MYCTSVPTVQETRLKCPSLLLPPPSPPPPPPSPSSPLPPPSPHSIMFWVDAGDHEKEIPPRIERATMDGSGRQVIVTDDLEQPRSITIDNYSGVGARIYWTDSSKGTIESARFDGTYRSTVIGTIIVCISVG